MNNLVPVVSYLINTGMTVQAACGIYGNLYAESSCRPEARNDKKKEVGIAQETGEGYDRYLAYADAKGKSWDDLYCQLDYILDNCINNRYKWQEKVDGEPTQQYGSVTRMRMHGYTVDLVSWDDFCRSTNIGQTTSSFLAIYEDCLYEWTAEAYGRPSLASWIQEQVTNRITYAKMAYDICMEDYDMVFSPKQTAPPQSALAYAGGTIYDSGCGVGAVMSLMGWSSLDKWKEVIDWMRTHGDTLRGIYRYEANGSGTYAEGVNEFLNTHGVKAVKLTDSHSEAGLINTAGQLKLKEHIKAGGRAWVLFGGRLTRCVTSYWSLRGHFCSIHAYDAKTDRFLVADPCTAMRDGWHTWAEITGNLKHYGIVDEMKSTTKKEVKEDMTVIKEIKLGDKGTHVYVGQTLLRGRGFKGKDGKALELDKNAGVNTIFARDAYCKARNIQVKDFWKDITGGLCR